MGNHYSAEDTIAAIATALSPSGIGIVRISGPDAFRAAEQIFLPASKSKKLSELPSGTFHYGHIADGEELIDEVIVLLMRKPHSYTGEDTVEIDGHGGILVLQRILNTVCKQGVRLAEPGEFSRRAFLNGRMDLSQAEAV
ncbi:MAG: tRNA uridine-5-carboxymethylaminomethyl(34) synthesis GTPase MnmE, partial [Lachnospiraceae bacterium]|nr:tRNA uridine-5-carboxymethylaminomethyl(34) synthesis GTPase MnmE [Lachnospiraceae bacterium]